jgi:hypothetical protein
LRVKVINASCPRRLGILPAILNLNANVQKRLYLTKGQDGRLRAFLNFTISGCDVGWANVSKGATMQWIARGLMAIWAIGFLYVMFTGAGLEEAPKRKRQQLGKEE